MRITSALLAGATALVFAALLPAQAAAQEKAPNKGPEVIKLEASRGTVTFPHAKHQAGMECTNCHHASKTEKPLTAEHQKCSDCHTSEAAEPMKTNLRFAFHNTAEKSGTCLTCHIKEAAEGKKAPTTCPECHVKAEGQ